MRYVTRGMLATVIHRMAGSPIVDYNMPFLDVPADMYYYNPICWAASTGIVTGYSATEFLPERNLSREEMVTMLWRYAGKPMVEPDAGFYSYTDVGSIQGYALPAMKWAYMKGIIKGVTTSTIVPGGNATRAQFATIMERTINIIQ